MIKHTELMIFFVNIEIFMSPLITHTWYCPSMCGKPTTDFNNEGQFEAWHAQHIP